MQARERHTNTTPTNTDKHDKERRKREREREIGYPTLCTQNMSNRTRTLLIRSFINVLSWKKDQRIEHVEDCPPR